MKCLLIGSKEGEVWRNATLFATGDLEEVRKMFLQRKRSFAIWYLIDASKLNRNFNNYQQLDLLFFEITKGHDNQESKIDRDYQFEPFVGFCDDIAIDRNWGLLKEWVEIPSL